MDFIGCTYLDILIFIKQQQSLIMDLKVNTKLTHESWRKIEFKEMLLKYSIQRNGGCTTFSKRKYQYNQNSTDYKLLIQQQSLCDAMIDIKKFEPGNDVNRYMTNLNKRSATRVRPDLTNHPRIKGQFVKAAKQQLDIGIFQPIEDSLKDTRFIRST